MAKKKIKKAIRAAGPNISKKEMNRIVKAAGGNVQKAVNRIASVQQSQKAADRTPVAVASGAANMLIKQAQKAPATQQTSFGTSKLGQTLQGMVAKPATSGTTIKGQRVGATPAQPGSLVPGGMVIRPGGNLAVKKKATRPTPITPTGTPLPETQQTEVINPYQDVIDALTDKVTGLEDTISMNDQYMQDYINQITEEAQLQAQQMSEMFNAQLAEQEAFYQQGVQQADLLAQQEREAARAFMINQGRMVNPANLQIGATYGTPRLAGTQGFKYRPQPTTAQVATAFTAPTLAAAAMTPQQLQPTMLNV